jgi:hypothetical protein
MEAKISGDKNTITNYLIHVLSNTDKAVAVRVDLINKWIKRDDTFLRLFKDRHKITTEDDLIKWVNDAKTYVFDIRKDIMSRLDKKTFREKSLLMNDEEVTNGFLEKYCKREEELKNDRFFQCG